MEQQKKLPQKALVIDDSAFTLRRHKELMEEAGIRVFAADNGEQAIAIFEENFPDIVLCDIMMPEMDGYELLEIVRDIHPGVFWYFVSGEMTEQIRQKARNLGAKDVIEKPLEPESIQKMISEYSSSS